VRYRLNSIERDLVETRLRLEHLLDALGRRDEAIQEWQAALRIDPENLVIRKQIWAARHPEKFFPTIDVAWQQEQLRQERAAEIASGICGPDGCPLPLSG
jgi:tetratricopeptide (TPR) repeat protein